MTSDQTGFNLDYLVELVGDISISSTTFEAAPKNSIVFIISTFPLMS